MRNKKFIHDLSTIRGFDCVDFYSGQPISVFDLKNQSDFLVFEQLLHSIRETYTAPEIHFVNKIDVQNRTHSFRILKGGDTVRFAKTIYEEWDKFSDDKFNWGEKMIDVDVLLVRYYDEALFTK